MSAHYAQNRAELCKRRDILLYKPGSYCCHPVSGCESQESQLLGLPANFFSCRGSNIAKGLHFSPFLVQEFYQEE